MPGDKKHTHKSVALELQQQELRTSGSQWLSVTTTKNLANNEKLKWKRWITLWGVGVKAQNG